MAERLKRRAKNGYSGRDAGTIAVSGDGQKYEALAMNRPTPT
ncbi:hypothetical protein [Paracoccus mutanolyticus]|nr:hypothetical protein [Paracoccus mutanolyticus]